MLAVESLSNRRLQFDSLAVAKDHADPCAGLQKGPMPAQNLEESKRTQPNTDASAHIRVKKTNRTVTFWQALSFFVSGAFQRGNQRLSIVPVEARIRMLEGKMRIRKAFPDNLARSARVAAIRGVIFAG